MTKPLSPEAVAALNSVLLRAVERMERKRKRGEVPDEVADRLAKAVAALNEELTEPGA